MRSAGRDSVRSAGRELDESIEDLREFLAKNNVKLTGNEWDRGAVGEGIPYNAVKDAEERSTVISASFGLDATGEEDFPIGDITSTQLLMPHCIKVR